MQTICFIFRIPAKYGQPNVTKSIVSPELTFGTFVALLIGAYTVKRLSERKLRRRRSLTPSEFTKLLAAAEPLYRQIAIFELETAFTRVDTLCLKFDQIKWAEGVIDILRGKTELRQTDWLSPPLVQVLRERQAEKVPSLEGYVFTIDGRPIQVSELQRMHRQACRKANIVNFNFHDWRRVAVSRWLEMGISAQLQKIASGHATTDGVHHTYLSVPNRKLAKIFKSKWKPYTEKFFGDEFEDVEVEVEGDEAATA